MNPQASVQPSSYVDRARRLGKLFAATAAGYDATDRFPSRNFEILHSEGLLGLTIAASRGGAGAGLHETVEVLEALAHGDPSTALVAAMHYLQHASIARDDIWPERIAAHLTAQSHDGVALINSLQAEPALGSPSRGGMPGTVARRVADGWRITGRKAYCTGSVGLRFCTVLAVTDEAAPRVGYFVVPLPDRGVRIVETWDQIGMRATASHEMVFEDVAIPADHAIDLRSASDGLKREPREFCWYLTSLAAVYQGAARAARDWLIAFLKERKPAGLNAPLSTIPRIQEQVGLIDIRLMTSASLLNAFARQVDGGRISTVEAGVVRHVVIENAVKITTQALNLAGNHGLSRKNDLERHHRNALCGRIHAPVGDILVGAVGRAAFES